MPEQLNDITLKDEPNMSPEIDQLSDEMENLNAVSQETSSPQPELPSDNTDHPDITSEEKTVSQETEPGPPADNADDEPSSSKSEPRDPDDIEEGKNAYHPGGFHPVYIGDVYAERYKIISKIGYGVYSTVWLVQDLKATDDKQKYRALKVLTAMAYDPDCPIFEKEILTHLRDGDRKLGYNYICHLLDDFEHKGPNGNHVCLVFEIMGETLSSFPVWFEDHRIPTSVMTRFTIQILLALNYAHRHGIIHTDIQPANIFLKFRDTSLIESGYLVGLPTPEQDRNADNYTPINTQYLRQYYFAEEDGNNVEEFDIALGDFGVASWKEKHLCTVIQPTLFRSPEVLIKAPWDETTDLWNLGPVLLEVHPARRMFYGKVTLEEDYSVKLHLHEIESFFGPFPREFLDKGDQDLVKEFFDDEGRIPGFSHLGGRYPLESESWMMSLPREKAEQFASFLRMMMKINPAERPTIKELLRHRWLGAYTISDMI